MRRLSPPILAQPIFQECDQDVRLPAVDAPEEEWTQLEHETLEELAEGFRAWEEARAGAYRPIEQEPLAQAVRGRK